MIKRLIVKNLHGKFDYDLTFNEDINIITGRNGSGKTTLMKLIWYLVSGNVNKIFEEQIQFDYIKIEYTGVFVEIDLRVDTQVAKETSFAYQPKKFTIEYDESEPKVTEFNFNLEWRAFPPSENLNFMGLIGESIFFPTFRMIESGFGLEINIHYKDFPNIEDAHKFIFATSTQSIVQFIIAKVDGISKEIDKLNRNQIAYISSLIEKKKETNETILSLIEQRIQGIKARKEALEMPITLFYNLLKEILGKNGTEIVNYLTDDMWGNGNMLEPNKLSFGEKQMLSFLAYNAFSENTVIFIDEPELSLHPDWQRQLVPMLIKQNTGNQLFMATHSAAIAAYYPEKEIWLDA